MKTRFILIQTSHAGNVGAAARALKVMGFDELVLVDPRWPNVLRKKEAIERSSGAHDVLNNARIVATLDEALDGITHLCATAMTPRDFGPPTRSPRQHFELLLNQKRQAQQNSTVAAGSTPDNANASEANGMQAGEGAAPEGIAFLFGCERYGMRNEDVYRCHACLSIPTNPGYGSLNLAAAVQLIAYEWRQALGGFDVVEHTNPPVLADAAQQAGMLQHWEQALVDLGFLDPAAPKKLMPRLNQLFNRAQPTQEDIHILRGIAKAMQKAAAQAKPSSDANAPMQDVIVAEPGQARG